METLLYINNEDKLAELANMYLAFQFYTMYHYRYLMYIQKETMEYTINKLTNKHDLKQQGSIFKAIYKK